MGFIKKIFKTSGRVRLIKWFRLTALRVIGKQGLPDNTYEFSILSLEL